MDEQTKFIIQVYRNGAVTKVAIRGRRRYLKEKAFLAELTGDTTYEALKRPVPDPPGDFYMLEDDQINKYSAFRKQLGE